jgi:hypothetical protein
MLRGWAKAHDDSQKIAIALKVILTAEAEAARA